jgi:hypothetical protein
MPLDFKRIVGKIRLNFHLHPNGSASNYQQKIDWLTVNGSALV